MRLTFIAFKYNFESGGGASFELDAKIRSLLKFGHTAQVVTLFSTQNNFPANLPYKVIQNHTHGTRLITIQKQVVKVLREYQNETDVFLVDGQFGYGSGYYRWRGGQAPVLVHFNRELSSFPASTRKFLSAPSFLFKQKVRFLLERVLLFPILNKNNLFTFTSPVLQNLYVSYGLNSAKTLVMPDFFNSANFLNQINKTQVLNLQAKQKTQFTILSGGRLVPEKGLDVVIRAFAKLKNLANYKLIITGDGSELNSLKKLAGELNISKQITFTGWVSKQDNYNLFKNADIYVVPRWRPELTSMIVLEAMAFMVPYIVTAGTALAWQAANSALFYVDEDSNGLTKRIEELAGNPSLRVKLINNGLIRLKELDASELAPKLNNALQQLKKTPQRP